MADDSDHFSQRKQLLFCFCAPAASGKSTICRNLAARDSSLRLSISTTSRTPRSGEAADDHYYFVTAEEFQNRVDAGAFVEHARFGSSRYGTERRNFEAAAAAGQDLLLDIDVQGVRQLRGLYPGQVVVTFVFPPSMAVLKQRFAGRGTETPQAIAERLQIARREIAVLREPAFSDYLLLNDDLEQSIAAAGSIIAAERLRFSIQQPAYLDRIFG